MTPPTKKTEKDIKKLCKNKKRTTFQNYMRFVPFSKDDFLPGSSGVDYLNDIIWTLTEQVNRLEKELSQFKKRLLK